MTNVNKYNLNIYYTC